MDVGVNLTVAALLMHECPVRIDDVYGRGSVFTGSPVAARARDLTRGFTGNLISIEDVRRVFPSNDPLRRQRRLWSHALRELESRNRRVRFIHSRPRREIFNERRLRTDDFGQRLVRADLIAPTLRYARRGAADAD